MMRRGVVVITIAACSFQLPGLYGTSSRRSLMYLSGASRESKWDEDARALREDGVVAGCSRVDDTPMTHVRLCRYTQTLKLIHHNTTLASLAQQVRLPFTFLFAGKRFRHAYLNANGGLFFDPAPPCGQYFAAGQPCSLTTSKPNS